MLADVAGELATVTSPDFRDHADSAHDLASMRLRITPAWDAAAAANVISEPIPTAFTAAVVVPIADRFTYLTPDRAEQLGGRDTVLHAAITNTITQELSDLDIRSQGLPDGHVVQAIAKDGSPYVTTCLLSVQ